MATPFDVPVVVIVFNRPDVTARLFERLRDLRPATLFVIADGPRPGRPDEAAACEATRAIARGVDWPCDVHELVSETNLGVRRRITSGLDGVFAACEQAIILEDDCLPDPSFFPYCRELLARYADEPQVMSVAGTNKQEGQRRGPYSYYFSRYEACWGWATWRRAWQRMDVSMGLWPVLRAEALPLLFPNPVARRRWRRELDATYAGDISSWAFAWAFAHFVHSGLAVTPNVNLVSNVGFGPQGTHTRSADSRLAALSTAPMPFPLRHPPYRVAHAEADAFLESTWAPGPLPRRALARLETARRTWRARAAQLRGGATRSKPKPESP